MAFSADAARNSMRAHPHTTDALLVTLRSDATDAVEAIRRLVYGMRPPALDELGLERACVSRLRLFGRGPVVCWRLTSTCLTRSRRWPPRWRSRRTGSWSRRCRTSPASPLGRSPRCCCEPRPTGWSSRSPDNGPCVEHWQQGVGVASMRERAARGATPYGGKVDAVLPML